MMSPLLVCASPTWTWIWGNSYFGFTTGNGMSVSQQNEITGRGYYYPLSKKHLGQGYGFEDGTGNM
jgi:hypothetical protein